MLHYLVNCSIEVFFCQTKIAEILHKLSALQEGVCVQIHEGIYPGVNTVCFLHGAAVIAEKSDDIIHIDPYFGITFFLTLVKHQLHTKMQVDGFNIIGIFLIRIAGAAHKADHIPRLDDLALIHILGKGRVLLQVGIIIVTLGIKGTDTDAPAAVAIPAEGFHDAGQATGSRAQLSGNPDLPMGRAGPESQSRPRGTSTCISEPPVLIQPHHQPSCMPCECSRPGQAAAAAERLGCAHSSVAAFAEVFPRSHVPLWLPRLSSSPDPHQEVAEEQGLRRSYFPWELTGPSTQ